MKSKSREIESINILVLQVYNVRKCIKSSQQERISVIKRCLKILKGNAVSAGKTTCTHLRKMTRSIIRAAETVCIISVLRTKPNASTAVKSYCQRKLNAEEDLANFVHSHLDSCVPLVQIMCTYDIITIAMPKLLLCYE